MAKRDLCAVCQGSGNLVTFRYGIEYWLCPGCGGAGVHTLHSPPTTHLMRRKEPAHEPG